MTVLCGTEMAVLCLVFLWGQVCCGYACISEKLEAIANSDAGYLANSHIAILDFPDSELMELQN